MVRCMLEASFAMTVLNTIPVFLLLALVGNLALASEQVYHIKPTSSSPCSYKRCYTLDLLAANRILNNHMYSKENVTVIFLPGSHVLSTKLEVQLYGTTVLTGLKSQGLLTQVAIVCKSHAYLGFSGGGFMFDGLDFSGCGGRQDYQAWDGVSIISDSVLTVANCSFRGTKGYRAFSSNSRETVLVNSMFDNSVQIRGFEASPTYGENYITKLNISSCTFSGGYGGSLRIIKFQQAVINASLFEKGQAHTYGGGMYILESQVSLTNVLFKENTAHGCGGLYMEKSFVNLTGAAFYSNIADYHSSLCTDSSDLRISNSSFYGNVGRNGTGGLFSLRSNITIKNSLFSANVGQDGGAIEIKQSVLWAENTAFMYNNASRFGGAVYAVSSVATFKNSFFMNNIDPLGKTIVAEKSNIVSPGTNCSGCRLSKAQAARLSGQCNSYEREKLNEDKRPCMYKDSKGIPTIGVGFNLRKSGAKSRIEDVGADYNKVLAGLECLQEMQIRQLFNEDMDTAVSCAQRFVGSNWYRIGQTRQSAVADMAFNLGCPRLNGFKKLRAALQSDPPDYNKAVYNMRDSMWCRQVKGRCSRDVACMK